MNVIVKFHTINPNWPDLVMENYTEIPPGFVEMSIEEYNALMALVGPEMKAYFDEEDRLIEEERLAREQTPVEQ